MISRARVSWSRSSFLRVFIFILSSRNWNFFDRSDPTNGLVNYQNADDAKQKKLAFIEGNSLILAVDNTTQLSYGAKRDS
jgi:hypothetical protein